MANKTGNINQQALKQLAGPVQGTADKSLTGQNAQNALAALQKSYSQMGPVQGTADKSLAGQNAQNALAALQKNYSASVGSAPAVGSGGGAMAKESNGIAASGGNAMNRTQQIPYLDDLKGVRATFNNAGIGNDIIGWDGQNVTLGGKAYITPQTVQDGTSYANRQDINRAINQYYNEQGKPLAGAESYVGEQLGVKGAVSWSDGNLMVGGQVVPTVYVDDDGTAYARQSDLDKAITAYRKASGITGNQAVYDNWENAYGGRIRKALKDITSRKEWSYDPENDPAYQAYKEQYIREGNRAYQDAYGQMAANTGGYGSSAAMNAAGQQMNYYMQQLNDRVPELMQNDYNRYLGEQELRRKALDSIRTVANDDYNKAYQANRDAVSDANEANYQSWLRSKDARDYNRDIYENDRDYNRDVYENDRDYNRDIHENDRDFDRDKEVSDRQWRYSEPVLQNQVRQSDIDTERYAHNADLDIAKKQMENWEMQAKKILTQYRYGNLDTPIAQADAEAIGIQAKADGTYPTIREMYQSYGSIDAMLEAIMWENAGRPQTLDTWNINNNGSY